MFYPLLRGLKGLWKGRGWRGYGRIGRRVLCNRLLFFSFFLVFFCSHFLVGLICLVRERRGKEQSWSVWRVREWEKYGAIRRCLREFAGVEGTFLCVLYGAKKGACAFVRVEER